MSNKPIADKPLYEQIRFARIVSTETGIPVTLVQLARWERLAWKLEQAEKEAAGE